MLTVTFGHFDKSLLNKNINFFLKNITDPKLLNSNIFINILTHRLGDDWKKSLQLPAKDNRVKTSVSLSVKCFKPSLLKKIVQTNEIPQLMKCHYKDDLFFHHNTQCRINIYKHASCIL